MPSVDFLNTFSGGPCADRGEMLEAAKGYAERGWALVSGPGVEYGVCGCYKGAVCDNMGKHPRGGWSDRERRTLSPGNILWTWGEGRNSASPASTTDNLFLVAYLSDLVIADVDSIGAWEKSREEGWDYPATLAARSGSGHGMHLIYRKTWDRSGAAPRLSMSTLPGSEPVGEVRWKGVIVLPPSAHVSGGRYEWMNTLEIADAPDWLAAEKSVNTSITSPPFSSSGSGSGSGSGGMGSEGTLRYAWAMSTREEWFSDVSGFERISSEYMGVPRNRPGIGFAIACRAGRMVHWGILKRTAAVQLLMEAAAANGWEDAERQIVNGIDTGVLEAAAMSMDGQG